MSTTLSEKACVVAVLTSASPSLPMSEAGREAMKNEFIVTGVVSKSCGFRYHPLMKIGVTPNVIGVVCCTAGHTAGSSTIPLTWPVGKYSL